MLPTLGSSWWAGLDDLSDALPTVWYTEMAGCRLSSRPSWRLFRKGKHNAPQNASGCASLLAKHTAPPSPPRLPAGPELALGACSRLCLCSHFPWQRGAEDPRVPRVCAGARCRGGRGGMWTRRAQRCLPTMTAPGDHRDPGNGDPSPRLGRRLHLV